MIQERDDVEHRKCINQDKNEVYDNDGYMFRIFCILDI